MRKILMSFIILTSLAFATHAQESIETALTKHIAKSDQQLFDFIAAVETDVETDISRDSAIFEQRGVHIFNLTFLKDIKSKLDQIRDLVLFEYNGTNSLQLESKIHLEISNLRYEEYLARQNFLNLL